MGHSFFDILDDLKIVFIYSMLKWDMVHKLRLYKETQLFEVTLKNKNLHVSEIIIISRAFHYYLNNDSSPQFIHLDLVYLQNDYYETHLCNML